jgi:hypothetical protein
MEIMISDKLFLIIFILYLELQIIGVHLWYGNDTNNQKREILPRERIEKPL